MTKRDVQEAVARHNLRTANNATVFVNARESYLAVEIASPGDGASRYTFYAVGSLCTTATFERQYITLRGARAACAWVEGFSEGREIS